MKKNLWKNERWSSATKMGAEFDTLLIFKGVQI